MVLVTGATGFLGAELALQLVEQGNSIRCTRRSTSKSPAILAPYADKIEWVEADMMDSAALEDALEGVDRVYHQSIKGAEYASSGFNAYADKNDP